MSKILVKHRGMLRQVKNMPFTPEISPRIQGQGAYDLLKPEQKAQLECALKDAAKTLKCLIVDLEWSFGRGHPVQPIRIKKRQRIEL